MKFRKINQLFNELIKEVKYPYLVDKTILCMNGNDGESFDWSANDRCCEFFMFYKDDGAGAIKVCINKDGTYDAYIYNRWATDPDFYGFDDYQDKHINNVFDGNVLSVHQAILKAEKLGQYDFNINE